MAAMMLGGREVESYYARGMLEIRTTLHLTARLGVRANQILQQSGAASGASGLWRASLPAFVVLDVVVWLVLRRRDRFGLAWRLALEVLDASFWVLSPRPMSGHYEWALLISIPLAVEAGVRLGWRGLLVPGALFVATGLAAVVAGKPVGLVGAGWIVLAVAMGAAFFRYCRHLDRRAEAERRGVLTAVRRRAFLGGQNHVAMGASSAVDVIEGLVPVLGRPEAGSALWRLAAGWKSQLSASTAQEATYLHVALLEWERAHNRHPDLASLVRVHVDEGQGTTLLTAIQARQLVKALDGLDLRGRVDVRLAEPDDARLPGRALRIDVGGHPVMVRADRRAAPPPLDPCAVTYFYIASLVAIGLTPAFGGLPVPAAVAGLALSGSIGIVSHRRILAQGSRARLGVFRLAVGVASGLTLLSGFARFPLFPDGDPILGFGASLLLLSFLGGFYWRSLGRWRPFVPVAMAGNVVLGLLVFPAPSAVTTRAVVASVVWNLFPFFPCRHLARALETASARHARSVLAVDEGAEHAAFLQGRESVVGLVRQARDDALRQLKRLEPQMDTGLASLAAGRLEEVEQRLTALQLEPGSSSSTTTG